MKRNLWLAVTSGAFLVAATGCLNDKTQEDPAADVGINPRDALVQALDNQATSLVNGLNKVIIEGAFIKNVSIEHPPEPIPMTDNNEVSKAIGYLLANQTQQGNSYSYKPDSRFCTEVVAKQNPNSCVQVLSKFTLTQTPADASSGILEVSISNAKPFKLYYSQDVVAMDAVLSEVVKALDVVNQTLQQNGQAGFGNSLPTTYAGALQLTISKFMGISTIGFSITSNVDLRGQNDNGDSYSLQAAAAQNLVSLSLDATSGTAYAALALPQVAAQFSIHNEQNIAHQLDISFPGLSGSLNLDNSLESVAIQAVKLASPDVYVKVDGQDAAHFLSSSQIDAHLQSYAGGDISIAFANEVSAQAEILANPIMNGNGQISVDIAQATEVYFKHGAQQAKVLSGSVQLLGTDSFTGSMDAQTNSCIEGQQNAPFPLQTAVCQF